MYMTLNDAFRDLTIDQVEKALLADSVHGFPQDVFGLARLMRRTFTVLSPDRLGLDGFSTEPLKIDQAIEQRIAGMLELERQRACQLEELLDSPAWLRDTEY
jgi:hypothetical protein